MKRGEPGRTTIRSLRPGEPRPAGEPRRYTNNAGYVRLRWKVARREYVETYERDDAAIVRTTAPIARRVDANRAARLYREGKTQAEVAVILGCNPAAVSKVLRRAGEPTRKPTSYRYPEPDHAEVVRLHAEEDLGADAISRRLGITRVRVARILREQGVAPRRPGRPYRVRGEPSYETEFQRARPLVRARSGGRCEAGSSACTTKATHVHHRKLRSQGGTNDLTNLLDCCFPCHVWLHHHPAAATERGLLVPSWADPATVPVEPSTSADGWPASMGGP